MTKQDPFLAAAKDDPFLDEGARGYIVNTAKREFWKMAEWYELDDLIADGYLCYYRCRTRYLPRIQKHEPTLAGQKKWLMALVKRAFFNHISTLASKRMAVHERAVSQFPKFEAAGTNAAWDALLPSQPEEGTFMTLLASAPAELKQLIQLLVQDGADLLKFDRKRAKHFMVRETTNEFYARVLGVSEDTDIVGKLKAHFG